MLLEWGKKTWVTLWKFKLHRSLQQHHPSSFQACCPSPWSLFLPQHCTSNSSPIRHHILFYFRRFSQLCLLLSVASDTALSANPCRYLPGLLQKTPTNQCVHLPMSALSSSPIHFTRYIQPFLPTASLAYSIEHSTAYMASQFGFALHLSLLTMASHTFVPCTCFISLNCPECPTFLSPKLVLLTIGAPMPLKTFPNSLSHLVWKLLQWNCEPSWMFGHMSLSSSRLSSWKQKLAQCLTHSRHSVNINWNREPIPVAQVFYLRLGFLLSLLSSQDTIWRYTWKVNQSDCTQSMASWSLCLPFNGFMVISIVIPEKSAWKQWCLLGFRALHPHICNNEVTQIANTLHLMMVSSNFQQHQLQ